MKLRLRSVESKETHKIEVPNNCNLQQLKQTLIHQLSPNTIHHNLFVSLNRKDELFGSSVNDSLQSLGITSGDLIYFSLNPNAFLSPNPNLLHAEVGQSSQIGLTSDKDESFMNIHMSDCGNMGEIGVNSCEIEHRDDKDVNLMDTHVMECGKIGEIDVDSEKNQELLSKSSCPSDGGGLVNAAPMIEAATNAGTRELSNTGGKEPMEVIEGNDGMEVDDESVSNVKARFSVPSFLKKVFVKEVGDVNANGGNHKLLVIAVHAVLLESGFVGYDPVSGMVVDGFHLPDEWPSSAFGVTLHYTLPEVSTSETVETIVLKFQTLGKYVNVYGSLPKKGFGIHRVCLDEPRFIPALSYLWKKSDYTDPENERDGSMKLYPTQEIFNFWKIVKDGISYPLLIEFCEHVGLVPPPCFMLLPTELRLKILESLPAKDVASVACVSLELHYIASNNNLWRLKYEEEFGSAASSQREVQWKSKFQTSWNFRKKRKPVVTPFPWRVPSHSRPSFPRRRDPNPYGLPFFIGGDYDGLPAFGIHQHRGRRIFRTNCDLHDFGV